MATAPTTRAPAALRLLSILVLVAGVVLVVAGVVTWFAVRATLGDEKITVSSDASHFAGDAVNGPHTAFVQADTIDKHATEISGGKTYAELPQDDPNRATVMTASFLRASLFTSVVSFGVAALAAGLGLVFLLIGWALLPIARALAAPSEAARL
jgi:hypothetical protein